MPIDPEFTARLRKLTFDLLSVLDALLKAGCPKNSDRMLSYSH